MREAPVRRPGSRRYCRRMSWSCPRSWSGRGPNQRLSDSVMGMSFDAGSRRRMSPFSANPHVVDAAVVAEDATDLVVRR